MGGRAGWGSPRPTILKYPRIFTVGLFSENVSPLQPWWGALLAVLTAVLTTPPLGGLAHPPFSTGAAGGAPLRSR